MLPQVVLTDELILDFLQQTDEIPVHIQLQPEIEGAAVSSHEEATTTNYMSRTPADETSNVDGFITRSPCSTPADGILDSGTVVFDDDDDCGDENYIYIHKFQVSLNLIAYRILHNEVDEYIGEHIRDMTTRHETRAKIVVKILCSDNYLNPQAVGFSKARCKLESIFSSSNIRYRSLCSRVYLYR